MSSRKRETRSPQSRDSGSKGLTNRIRRVARENFGFDSLHLGQEDAILALIQGRDALVVQPTGSGKSAIYQIAGLLIEGPTVIVSPLIALQKDQADSIRQNDLPAAAVVNSRERIASVREALAKLERDHLEYLFLAPEQLHKPEMLERLQANPPSLFVVDEAHCISEWGHDFRPDYLRLGGVIEALGHPAVLALTATAAPLVREEIIQRLGLRNPAVIVRGFDRPNIFLRVDAFRSEQDKREALLSRIDFAPKPGLVYAATRKHVEEIGRALIERGLNAGSYHGGMKTAERQAIQEAFMTGDTDVLVATNAFGMGVDKSDVRFVYHFDIPDSLDSYYQEIGRCGRDGKPAEAVLFYRPEDLRIPKFLKSGGKLEEHKIRQVEDALRNTQTPMDVSDLRQATDLSQRKVEKIVNRLAEAGAVERLATGEAVLSEGATDLDRATREAAEEDQRHRNYDALRLEKMQAYAELRNCRREYLLRYFGDEEVSAPCDACDNCERAQSASNGHAAQANGSHPNGTDRVVIGVHSRVEHAQLGRGVVEKYEGDRIEILFDDGGRKTLAADFLVRNGLLRPMSDAAPLPSRKSAPKRPARRKKAV